MATQTLIMKWFKEHKLGKYIELIPYNFSLLLGVENKAI